MERYFIFDKVNSWYDWHCVLTDKSISDPDPKTHYIELDGANGSIDLTESLTGSVMYKDRTISASFWCDYGTRDERERMLKDIVRQFHGKKVEIIEPDDPEHFFVGRLTIKNKVNIIPYCSFTIEATCEPWRYSINPISRIIDLSSDESVTAVIHNNGVKVLLPLIVTTDTIKLYYGDTVLTLERGIHSNTGIKLYPGVNTFPLVGNGIITFGYREAGL